MTEFEFSIRDYVEQDKLLDLIPELFDIESDSVSNYESFFDLIESTSEFKKTIGVKITYSSIGYKVLLNCYSNVSKPNSDELNIAIVLSRIFNTQVAIGNITEDSDYIVCDPYSIRLGYEEENGEVFDLKLGEELFKSDGNLSEFKRKLDKIESKF